MLSEPNNLIALRQEFHQFPELGFNENRTKTRISGILKDLGLEVHEGLGVVGILRAGKGNRAIALRADMNSSYESSRSEKKVHTNQQLRICTF